ncbi:MAG: hypothetical protein Ct9H90mP11_02940 [Acidimicrobiales bacterium]|nr:MAG: hypothetical protein Ct9H90mP11_02940 [Acidimicrobiales bacterium]
MTKSYFATKGIEASIHLSYGATEAKAPEIVDAVVDITETGRALRAAGLKVIGTVLTSFTELIANPESTLTQISAKQWSKFRHYFKEF